MAASDRLHEEMVELFGEETVNLALAQEILAQRFALRHPIEVRKALYGFQTRKTLEEQKEFVAGFDKDLARAFICSLLCDTATKALQEIAVDALEDKRAGRAVLPNRLDKPSMNLDHLKKRGRR